EGYLRGKNDLEAVIEADGDGLVFDIRFIQVEIRPVGVNAGFWREVVIGTEGGERAFLVSEFAFGKTVLRLQLDLGQNIDGTGKYIGLVFALSAIALIFRLLQQHATFPDTRFHTANRAPGFGIGFCVTGGRRAEGRRNRLIDTATRLNIFVIGQGAVENALLGDDRCRVRITKAAIYPAVIIDVGFVFRLDERQVDGDRIEEFRRAVNDDIGHAVLAADEIVDIAAQIVELVELAF